MGEAITISVLQMLFQLSRTLGVRYTAKEHIVGTMVLSFIIQSLWLITTAMGVKAVFDMDWLCITGYMAGGLLGSYLAMRKVI